MAFVISRTFTRSAPGKINRSQLIDLRVTDMTAADAWWWDTRLGPRHAGIAGRADRYWSWSALLPACHLVQLAKRRYCRPLVIWGRADNGLFVRVGMSIIIESYPHLEVGDPGDSSFMWFMAAADPGVLSRSFGMSNPPSLGRTLLDNAMVLSENAGLGGRISLHAAASGGAALLAVYQHLGLLNLPATAPMPASVKRGNDGRFFYADAVTAQALLQALDPLR